MKKTQLFFANLKLNKDKKELEIFVNGRIETMTTLLLNRLMGTLNKGEKVTISLEKHQRIQF